MTDESTVDEPSTFREITAYLLETLRSGGSWAGWTDDGRPAFGDADEPVPEGVEVVHAAEDIAVLAGVMAVYLIQRSGPARPPGPNRAERRRAARDAKRRRVA